ncbi:hypothetical protein KUTeg_003503 [Tegillarca granosa]|uniref:Ketosynthase family 3 (KS3) domain-containing protein n=1 Tax=Tegillarca granosa TaxID=220873 RepID=A0ABQ9FMA4_TEGGR|nr:hypothetical protein KUTeg_003503 [Tegillarca granosa]
MDEPIAIVGVGCQFPGANNLDEFWRLLVNGENHVNEIPKERWNLDYYYDPNPDTPNKTYVRRAGLIDGHDEWDNRFYGISSSEAEQIDPQQRLVMDCVHMALEDGGITKTKLNGTYTGVYIGVMNDDYRGAVTGDGDHLDHYTLTGSSPSIASARVSYHYNLLGPAITIDTACSSALVAIHLATQALKTGDCKMAICGGVNSILYPEIFIPLSKARMVSPSGQCQAFSKNANGYARGEGCGIVVLKPLSMALADNDHIWATVMTGCNQDGHTATPITAPSVVMQGELLKKMYGQNNINPKDIQYIEAHGTGTPTGDPVEATALGQFFHREDENRIYVGSVKTNIAHLESAAGSAGLVKVLLMMKNGKFVPSLHVTELNPAVPFEKFGMKLVQEMMNQLV